MRQLNRGLQIGQAAVPGGGLEITFTLALAQIIKSVDHRAVMRERSGHRHQRARGPRVLFPVRARQSRPAVATQLPCGTHSTA